MRDLLVRGMVAGVLAGAASAVFGELFGETPIEAAIGLEEHHAGAHAEPEVVSRTVQSLVGLPVAVLVYGLAIGGLFAVVVALAQGRIGPLGRRGTPAVVALIGFLSVALVPFLKYPPNPPAVGQADTIGRRSGLYLVMVLASVALGVAAVLLARRLAPRLGVWNAVIAAALGFVLAAGLLAWLMPVIDEVPAGFPASLLWRFRIASLGTLAVLWATLGLSFGALSERAARRAEAPRDVPVSA